MVPSDLRTERLHLRCWRPEDAALLLPILEANVQHLRDWIPAHVFTPVPLQQLEDRLTGFATDFLADRAWRFAIFSASDGALLGEVSLFPRSAEGRVPFRFADRVEIGYWLRADVMGRGYATEAARAMLDLAASLPGVRAVEIRCDPRNAPSAAIPKRLAFSLEDATGAASTPDAAADAAMMTWVLALNPTS